MRTFHLKGFSIILVSLAFGLSLLLACGPKSTKPMKEDEILEKGSILFSTYGCFTCHSLEGTAMYGPALNEIYNKDLHVVRAGKLMEVKVDRDYLKKSILEPDAEKDSAYLDKTMPLPIIKAEDVEILVDYIITLNMKNNERTE